MLVQNKRELIPILDLKLNASLELGHWCSLIKGEKRYGVRLRGNGEIIKT